MKNSLLLNYSSMKGITRNYFFSSCDACIMMVIFQKKNFELDSCKKRRKLHLRSTTLRVFNEKIKRSAQLIINLASSRTVLYWNVFGIVQVRLFFLQLTTYLISLDILLSKKNCHLIWSIHSIWQNERSKFKV